MCYDEDNNIKYEPNLYDIHPNIQSDVIKILGFTYD